jgi:hypothetical protein
MMEVDTLCIDQQQQGPLSVAAPHTVHDEEKHSSTATHLLSVVKPIGISSSQVGRMGSRASNLATHLQMKTQMTQVRIVSFPLR